MRQLKQALKTKKNEIHGCGTSQCVTLNCRRLNDEFCGCGDGGGGGGDIPITNLYNLPMAQEIFPGETVTVYFNYEPNNATNVDEQINIYALNISGQILVSSGMGQPGEYWFQIQGVSPGEAEVECELNGTRYFGTPVIVAEPVAIESCDFPANMVVYTGGGAGANQDVGQISYSPTNATHPENQISLTHYDGEYVGDFYLRDCENGDGIIWFNGAPDDYVGRTVTYKGMVNGEYVSDIDVEVKKGVSVIDSEFYDVELGVGETNQNNWFAVTDYTGDIESLEITHNDDIASVLFNEEIVDGHTILRVYVVGRAEGNTRLQIEDTRGYLYGFNINVTEAVVPVESVFNLTGSTNVFNGGSEGFNLDVGSFEYTPTNASQVYDDVTFVPSNEDVGTLYISNANNGVATLGFNPSMESSQIGDSFSYDAYLDGEPVGSSINLYTNEGTRIASANFSDITLQVGNTDSSNNFALDDNTYFDSIKVVYDDNVISVGFIDNGIGYDIQVTGVNEGNTYFQIEDVYGNILGFGVNVTSVSPGYSNMPSTINVYGGGDFGKNNSFTSFNYTPEDMDAEEIIFEPSDGFDYVGDLFVDGYSGGTAYLTFRPDTSSDNRDHSEHTYDILLQGEQTGDVINVVTHPAVGITGADIHDVTVPIGGTDTSNYILLNDYSVGFESLNIICGNNSSNIYLTVGDIGGNQCAIVNVEGVISGYNSIDIEDTSGTLYSFSVETTEP